MSGEYDMAGTVGLYERDNEKELLKIPGPTKEDMSLYVRILFYWIVIFTLNFFSVQIIFKGKHKNLGIRYEYTLSSNSTAETIYNWKLLEDWSTCSKTCGTGEQIRIPVCYKRWEGIVEDDFCWKNAENKRPEKATRPCNENACPAFWWIGKWQPCSCPVDGELTPTKRRTIMCAEPHSDNKFFENSEMALPDSRCDIGKRPNDVEPCNSILPACKSEEINEINISDNEINNSI